MQRIAFGAVLGAMLVGGTAALSQAPSWTPPPESARCPSKWGAGDERGSANHMKPQAVLNAVKLIKTGEVIELGHVLGAEHAVLRHAALRRARQAHIHERSSPIGAAATRRSCSPRSGRSARSSTASRTRPTRTAGTTASRSRRTRPARASPSSASHKVGALITRGVLIDVAGFKGVETLGDSYEITVEDLEGALKKQNVTLQPGDAVIINTGWGKL